MNKRVDVVTELEGSFEKVETIRAELEPAEERLETVRQKVWRMMGGPTFGFVRLGRLRFSKSLVIFGAAFGGLLLGALITPLTGLVLAGLVVGVGVVWIKATFGR